MAADEPGPKNICSVPQTWIKAQLGYTKKYPSPHVIWLYKETSVERHVVDIRKDLKKDRNGIEVKSLILWINNPLIHQSRNGIDRILDASEVGCLPLHLTTIAERLKVYGYSNRMVGKWHLGFSRPECLPTRRGFDSFIGKCCRCVLPCCWSGQRDWTHFYSNENNA